MECCVLKALFDFFVISIVGFVAGIWIMIGATSVDFSSWFPPRGITPSDDLPTFAELQAQIAEPPKPLKERKIDPGATHDWLLDAPLFIDDLKYLEEANCSDHALRQYAVVLEGLDTSGFDRETGRLIDAEGKVVSRFGWRLIWKTQAFMLQPLQYMKAEQIPDNFKHVMQAVPKIKNRKTCQFRIPMNAMIRSLQE